MERRRSQRINVGFNAELISEGISYAVVIENLSETGINVITSPAKNAIDFTPKTPLELNFQPQAGETLNLNCRVIWSHKVLPHGLTNRIGMEILDPSWDKSVSFL